MRRIEGPRRLPHSHACRRIPSPPLTSWVANGPPTRAAARVDGQTSFHVTPPNRARGTVLVEALCSRLRLTVESVERRRHRGSHPFSGWAAGGQHAEPPTARSRDAARQLARENLAAARPPAPTSRKRRASRRCSRGGAQPSECSRTIGVAISSLVSPVATSSSTSSSRRAEIVDRGPRSACARCPRSRAPLTRSSAMPVRRTTGCDSTTPR